MPDYRLEIVNRQSAVARTAEILAAQRAIALDIETIEWWNRQREKIALLQFAFRAGEEVKVVIVDALADCELAPLRQPLESKDTTKIIHNAAFDAVKIFNHYRIRTTPIFDTMLAARQSGEKKYSLQSQAASHLNIFLNKAAQRSDWSRRPLDMKQIDYAARDAFTTLLLYEHQTRRNLAGHYSLREDRAGSPQPLLPLDEFETAESVPPAVQSPQNQTPPVPELKPDIALPAAARALLGIVSELPGRYGPEQLSVAVGADRVGLAGWIVDRFLGREADLDEETAKLIIGDLCERRLIRITEFRRLEATDRGDELWREIK